MLEGNTNATYWDWKDTLGPLKDRPGFPGTWSYQQTHGLGIMEYLEWAEDMDLQIGKSVDRGNYKLSLTKSFQFSLCGLASPLTAM